MKEKINNNITELVFVIDRSGSMSGLESDTVGGFNSLIAKQKKEEGKCLVTTILFDDKSETLHDRIDISEIGKMTEKEYFVRGCTALIDALGGAVKHISKIHKYARKEDVPANTMFVVITDGMENASHIYTSDEVKKMISEKQEIGWEFLFIGANIDAVETAGRCGIDPRGAVDYIADSKGTDVVYDSVCCAVSSVRKHGSVEKDWGSAIKKDYKSRKSGK